MSDFLFWNSTDNNGGKIRVGGKGESLLRLARKGIRVPSFLIIPSSFFFDFLERNKLTTEIDRYVEKRDFASIKRLIQQTDLSADFIDKINKGIQSLETQSFSVRSSAINEDGTEQSYAGQYDTFLFVKPAALPDAIKKCWASYFNSNIVEYEYHKPDLQTNGMAVIIQTMIDAVVSGVAFSIHPTAGTDRCLIEVAPGVGESLVSGRLTPNKIEVDNKTLTIYKCASLQQNNFLSESQITAIHSTILSIRKEYGLEVDTEWCYNKNGTLYFLQARPITHIATPKIPYRKTLTRPFSLFRIQLYQLGEFNGLKSLTGGNYYLNPLFISHNGVTSIYYNFLSQKENPSNIFDFLNNNVDLQVYATQSEQIANKLIEFIHCPIKDSITKIISQLIFLYPFSSLGNLAGTLPQQMVGKCYNMLIKYRERYDTLISGIEAIISATAQNKHLKDSDYLTIDEIFGNAPIPSSEVITLRKRGYIYFNEELILEKTDNVFNEYLNENNIKIEENCQLDNDSENTIRGDIAYNGIAKGRICTIFSKDDLGK
ncbi:MAG: hypothetical protein HDQ88_03455, partial [Clostridia bacterium]|nr:hypothetical protein [Clostridia bacterium]